MEKTEQMLKFEATTGIPATFKVYGSEDEQEWDYEEYATEDYVESLEAKAEAYDRLIGGGKKTLKEWANIFGMPIAVDHDGEASSFAHVPVIHLDDGEGIWGNNPEHYGEETYLLPPHLIDFDGDWKDSLTLPDGWEELCSHST